MKRTKSMIYKETAESKELFLYATNNGDIYRRIATPAIDNLRKKAKKGLYNSEKAVDLWYYMATEASIAYNKEFGSSFTVQERFSAAVEIEKYYKEEVFYNF